MRKTPVGLSPRAKQDLRELKKRIEAAGAPRTAKSFVARLRKRANVLRDFPEIGWVVEDLEIPSIREIVFQGYRIVYEYDGAKVRILTIFHGSRLLRSSDILGS